MVIPTFVNTEIHCCSRIKEEGLPSLKNKSRKVEMVKSRFAGLSSESVIAKLTKMTVGPKTKTSGAFGLSAPIKLL